MRKNATLDRHTEKPVRTRLGKGWAASSTNPPERTGKALTVYERGAILLFVYGGSQEGEHDAAMNRGTLKPREA